MPNPKNDTRFIVVPFRVEVRPIAKPLRFTKSRRGAESVYTDLGIAKRQAPNEGDRVFEIDFSRLRGQLFGTGDSDSLLVKLAYVRHKDNK
jgi:hypothetical protein